MKRVLSTLLFIVIALSCFAQEMVVINGVVKDLDTKKRLENVNVTLSGHNVGTVTNADGVFSLKVNVNNISKGLLFSHLGYLNTLVSWEEIEKQHCEIIVWMNASSGSLQEVIVYGGEPQLLVKEAIRKIPENYADKSNLFSAFYRETIQKGRRYIGISEAVMDIYKTGYQKRSVNVDRAQILRGRRLMSQKPSDTLAVKVAGGPMSALFLDIAKNGDDLLDASTLYMYEFELEKPVSLDKRMQFVVSFRPAILQEYALYRGKLYIDQQGLFFTRAEFELDMSSKEKVVHSLLYKKPVGLRFNPREVSYLVTYKQQGDRTYLNYVRNVMRFKCDWKKRLFSSQFITTTEIVMVDRKEVEGSNISWRDSYKKQQVFYDIVDEYWVEDFWKDYNIIEPTESLEEAVKKLRKQK